jgi:hypothetical protein
VDAPDGKRGAGALQGHAPGDDVLVDAVDRVPSRSNSTATADPSDGSSRSSDPVEVMCAPLLS